MAKKSTKESGPSEPPIFEEALARLEAIVHELEEGQTGLAESLDRYEEGVKLLRQCYELLEGAEQRIEHLSGVDAEGNALTEPFSDEQAVSLEDKAAARSRRRSHGGKKRSSESAKDADMDGSQGLF